MFLSSSRNREGQSSHWAFSTAPSLFSDLGDQRDPTLQYTRPQRGPDAECSSPCFHGLKSTDGCITLAAAAAAECAIHQGPTDAVVLRRRRRGVTLPPSLSFTPSHSLRHPPPIRVARRGPRHPLAPRWPRSPLSPPLSPTALGKTHFDLTPLLRPSVRPSVALARQPRGVARPLESSMSFEWHGH